MSVRATVPRAFRRDGFAARTLPLGAALVLGLILLFSLGPSADGALLAASLGAVALLWLFTYLTPWHRLPRWTDLIPPLAILVLLLVLRRRVGEGLPGVVLAPLFMVPTFWVALYGERRDVLVLLAALAVLRLVPPLVQAQLEIVGYAGTAVAVSTIVCIITHNLVDQQRRAVAAEAASRADLALQQARLSAILATVHDGVAILDHARRGLYANPAYLELFGLDAERFAGLTRDAFIAHASRLADDPVDFATRLSPLSPRALEDEDRFTFVRPRRRIMRRTIQPMTLPDGHGYLVVWHDITADHELALERERQALTDPLTGLANRREATSALEREIARARRTGAPLSVVLIDLDLFKQVNDRHGHAVGDRVLTAVAGVLTREARVTDVIARWGGEEFLALLPGDATGARAYAERVRAALAALDVAPVAPVTISAGVAVLAEGETADQVLRRADAQLYEAKRAGRDRVVGS